MSDNPKEVKKEMEKAIFISADCWLEVFDLLPPSQLGLGIAMISHRFDYFVDEHFKTRKWKLGRFIIRRKIGENVANEMEIVNSDGKELPISQIQLSRKVIGFRRILIHFIDQNVLDFLRRFDRFFATCETTLSITSTSVRISEFVVLNILPMLKDTIHDMALDTVNLRQMRQFDPSILRNCPSLRFVNFYDNIYLEFPPDDSANASDGQAVAKWLFTPRADNLPNMLNIENSTMEQWLANVEQIKAAFSIASSPVRFRFVVDFPLSSSLSSVVPFELTNEFTGEKLTLSQHANTFKIIRRPIVPKKKLQKIVELNDRWNQIYILIGDDDDCLLDSAVSSPAGPSGHQ